MFDKLLNLFWGKWFGPIKRSKTNQHRDKQKTNHHDHSWVHPRGGMSAWQGMNESNWVYFI